MRSSSLVLVAALAGCGAKQAAAPPSDRGIDEMEELGLLMKNDINPAFSKLTFLVFHGESMQEDPNAVRAELQTAATVLRASIARLRSFSDPPTQTPQGREVFFTYAAAVDQSTQKLVDAIAQSNQPVAATQMEQIAKTCNSCHHFFRLQIEDSVIPAR